MQYGEAEGFRLAALDNMVSGCRFSNQQNGVKTHSPLTMTDTFSMNVGKLLNSSSGSLFVNLELENSTVDSWGFQRTWTSGVIIVKQC